MIYCTSLKSGNNFKIPVKINAFFLFIGSNYIPEVRIMSIPNLRYMKVSTFLINRKTDWPRMYACVHVGIFGMGCGEQGKKIIKELWLSFLNLGSWQ